VRLDRTIAAGLAIALAGALLLTAVARAGEIHVAPDGSDANPGTTAKPLAGLDQARLAARKARAESKDPITVYLGGGTYYLPKTVVFTPEDSGAAEAPITYAARPGERVTIKGSLPVEAPWKPYRDGIYRCSLKGTPLEGARFNQLFCNDRRMVRARCPDWDFDDPLRTGKGYLQVESGGLEHMIWKPGDLDDRKGKWSNPTTGIVHAFHRNNWGNMQYRIGRIDWARRRIALAEGGWQCQRRTGPGKGRGRSSPYYIENLFEELDAPHEWFLDTSSSTLYFCPPKGVDLSRARVEAAVARRLIEFRGTPDAPVHHINLKGLHLAQTQATFMDTCEDLARGDWAIHRGGSITFRGAEDCRVDDCHIEQVGGNGIFVDGYNRRIHVAGCLIENLGDSAICFVGRPKAVRNYQTWSRRAGKIDDLTPGPASPDYPADCSIRNSITRDVGAYGKQTSGVLVSMSMGITISHCTVYNIPRAGITFNDGTWGGHVLEHCDIWDTVQDTGEHGPFNSWGRERFWNGLKKDLVLLDAIKTVHIRNNRIANYRKSVSAGNWTIDLDDGSSNFHIYNNLSLGSTLKLRDGYFRKVTNNIHVSGVPLGWHCWPSGSDDEFFGNITVITGSPVGGDKPQTNLLRPAGRMCPHPWGKRHDHNLWWNLNTRQFSLAGMTWEAWRARGYGEGSVFADPMFIDPAGGDYRVKPESPAMKLGFKNFPMDQFGHQMTRIVPFGGQFEKSVAVTIRPDARGGEVRYTLDGSDPTPRSKPYAGPLTLTAAATVKARTFKDGLPVGFPETATFEKVEKAERPTWLASLLAGHWIGGEVAPAKSRKPIVKPNRWRGMTVRDIAGDNDLIDASGGQDYGVFIETVPAGSPAAASGFKKADVIIACAGQKTTDLAALRAAERKAGTGDISVTVMRGYDKVKVMIPARLQLDAATARLHGKGVRKSRDHISHWQQLDEWVSWPVAIAKPGTYIVELVYACRDDRSGTQYAVTIGKDALEGTVAKTGGWSDYAHVALGRIKVEKAGTYTLSVKPTKIPRGAVMNLRSVMLSPAR